MEEQLNEWIAEEDIFTVERSRLWKKAFINR